MRHAGTLLLTLCIAVAAHGGDPNTYRGIDPTKVYDTHGLDSIDPFSGSLHIAIPLGLPYAVGPGFTYQFMLSYNSRIWDYEERAEGDEGRRTIRAPIPETYSNAGTGWLVTLGKVLKPRTAGWTYVGADGRHHEFAHRLPDGWRTTDGSYLRMTLTPPDATPESVQEIKVETPDGLTHVFGADGELQEIRDKSGHWLRQRITGDLVTVTDGHGATPQREHRITFATSTLYPADRANAVRRIRMIELAAFSSPVVAEYILTYKDPVVPADACGTSEAYLLEYGGPEEVRLPLLDGVTLPDGSTYEPLSHLTKDEPCTAGLIKELKLPTGGVIAWKHTPRALPRPSCYWNLLDPLPAGEQGAPDLSMWTDAHAAVERRDLLDATGNVLEWVEYAYTLDATGSGTGQWACSSAETTAQVTYTEQLPPQAARTTITRNDSMTTLHFSAYRARDYATGFTPFARRDEYGLPFTRATELGPRFLSRQDKEIDGTVKRTHYITYEDDDPGTERAMNARFQGARTVYDDDVDCGGSACWTDRDASNYDGYGKYRTTTETGNFTGAVSTRTTFTNYEPRVAEWLLNTYTEQSVKERGTTARELTVFDDRGLLASRRILIGNVASEPADSAQDLYQVFCRDGRGRITHEWYFGGDDKGTNTIPTADPCTAGAGVFGYHITHTYEQSGDTTTHKAYTNGDTIAIAHEEVHTPTGLLAATYDAAGFKTTFAYDLQARLTSSTPAGLPWTTHEYSLTPVPSVKTTRGRHASSEVLTGEYRYFDAVGRPVQDKRQLPEPNAWAATTTEYDGRGRVWRTSSPERTSASSYESEPFTPHLTTIEYDIFDRPRKITTPNNADSTAKWTGVRSVEREISVGTTSGVPRAKSIEQYDVQGRLVAVQEPTGTKTTYTYDVGGRLATVCQNYSNQTCGQKRTFTYDNRGYLLFETHPEQHLADAATAYTYDARAHVRERWLDARLTSNTDGTITATSGTTILKYLYDASERLLRVTDAVGTLLLEYEYGSPGLGAPHELGKLKSTRRRNGTSAIDVVNTFEYHPTNGVLAAKTTSLRNANANDTILKSVRQAMTLDEYGLPKNLSMPTCDSCGTGGHASVTLQRKAGYLTGIEDFASLSYNSNGTVRTVTHLSNPTVIDTYVPNAGFTRPGSIQFSVGECKPPLINEQPTAPPTSIGSVIKLTVGVAGDGVLSYQWFKGTAPGGVIIDGATSSSLTLEVTGAASYWVRVTNHCGTATDSADVHVALGGCLPARLDRQLFITSDSGGRTISVYASGTDLRYRWFELLTDLGEPCESELGEECRWRIVPGDNGSSLTTMGVGDVIRTYRVEVAAACGNPAMSEPVRVAPGSCSVPIVNPLHPAVVPLAAGQPHTLSITVISPSILPPGFTYDWYKPGVQTVAHSSQEPSIVVRPVETVQLFARVGTGSCRTTTNAQTLVVTSCSGVVIHSQPPDLIVPEGQPIPLVFDAYAPGHAVRYHWFEGAVADRSKPIATTVPNSLSGVVATHTSYYWVEIAVGDFGSAGYCAVASRTIKVTVCPKPTVELAPEGNLIAQPGVPAVVGLNVGGDELSIRWYEGQVGDTSRPVGEEGSRSLQLSVNRSADYWVRVSSGCHPEVVVLPFHIAYCEPVVSTITPSQLSFRQGEQRTLAVADPQASLRYAWQLLPDGWNWVSFGQIGPVLDLSSLGPGTYIFRVITDNGLCSAPSGPVTVTVCTPPVVDFASPSYVSSTAGAIVNLVVNATDRSTIRWYEHGPEGPTWIAEGTATWMAVAPRKTTDYSVRALLDGCEAEPKTVTVHVCTPAISTQPADDAIVAGASRTLTVAADGTPPLSYQWYVGTSGDTTSPIAGATTTSVEVAPSVTTQYWVQVTSPCGVAGSPALSRTAVVTVCQPPRITTQPVGRYVTKTSAAMSVTLSIVATGTNPTYAWYRGERGVPGPVLGNDRELTVAVDTTASYWCRVSACGLSEDSSIAVVDVCLPPAVTLTPPGHVLLASGQAATFVIEASGESLAYQWYRGELGDVSTPVSSADPSSAPGTLVTPQLLATTKYWARVTSKGRCSTDSSVAIAEVVPAPSASVWRSPSTTTRSGHPVTLMASSDDQSASCQWFRGASGDTSIPVSGACMTTIYPSSTSYYWARVSNAYGYGDSAALSVDVCGATITAHPEDRSIQYPGSTTLSVAAQAETSPTFRWYTGSVPDRANPISGGTQSSLTVAPGTTSTYWVEVMTGCGLAAESRTATVTVSGCTAPAIAAQPGSVRIISGATATLTVQMTGTLVRYQWYRWDAALGEGYAAIPGATGETLTVAPTTSSTAYYVIGENGCGAVQSAQVVVTVSPCTAPAITQHPMGATFVAGASATFTVAGSGTDLQYQWFIIEEPGGTAYSIAGATSSSLTTYPSRDGAQYYVRVFNECGSVVSAVATASLCTAPTISGQYWGGSIIAGQAVTLWATVADGAFAPVNIQWYHGSGQPIAGAVYATQIVAPTTTTTYYAKVWNACGTTYTAYIQVSVQVCVPPTITSQPVSQQIAPGESATLSVGVAPEAFLTYQWYESVAGGAWQPMQQQGATISVSPTTSSSYYVNVTTACTSIQSNHATITIAAPCTPPNFDYWSMPDYVWFTPGNQIALSVYAWGTNLNYQWYRAPGGGVTTAIPGATSAYLIDTPPSNYTIYSVEIWNACGFVRSRSTIAYDQTLYGSMLRPPTALFAGLRDALEAPMHKHLAAAAWPTPEGFSAVAFLGDAEESGGPRAAMARGEWRFVLPRKPHGPDPPTVPITYHAAGRLHRCCMRSL